VPLVITSAAPPNGEGYGALLAFGLDGKPLGTFSNDSRISDPRGLAIDGKSGLLFLNSGSNRVLALNRHGEVVRDSGAIPQLDPGGAIFGPDGRYYITLRSARTIMALPASLDGATEYILPPGVVPFPRGFAFDGDRALFLASGIGPAGEGDNSILAFDRSQGLKPSRFVSDPLLSPLDLTMAPNGNIVVSSECPFGASEAATTVREYDAESGRLVRVFTRTGTGGFRKPRGLRFGPDGNLYCVAQDEVVEFDFTSGAFLGTPIQFPRLHGQALAFFP
jgi:DNA-binding beta-propeller fold protein YncE